MPKTWRTETDMSGMPAPLLAAISVMGGGSLFVVFQKGLACSGSLDFAGGWSRDSRKPCLPQIVIGLDHFTQLVLGGAVALVVVGGEALNQFLEARLDVGLSGGVFKIELAQALPLEALKRPLWRPGCLGGSAIGEHPERIVGGEAVGEAAGARAVARATVARPGIDADEPGRTVPGRVVLLVLDHLFVGETGKIIIPLVVLAHMVEAEAMILALLAAALGRGVEARLLAPLPFASRTGIAQQAVLVRLDAQAVEEFRVELHGAGIMRSGGRHNKNGPSGGN